MSHTIQSTPHMPPASDHATPHAGLRVRLADVALAGTGVLARGVSHLVRAAPVPLRYAPADAVTALLARVWLGRIYLKRNYATLTGLPADGPVVQALARRSLRNFGRMAVDFLAARAMRADELLRWVTPVGEPYLAEARAAGRGVIFAMPHLGSWDVAGAYAAAYGFPVTVVVENDLTARLVAGARAYEGVTIVARDRSLRALFTALARNEGVVLISDIAHGDTPTTRVPFFGRLAAFPTGPAQLAIRTGAPVIVLGCVRLDGGTYRIEGEAPLWPAAVATRSPGEAAVHDLTARIVAGYARLVARYPDHWYPFHQVWDDGQ